MIRRIEEKNAIESTGTSGVPHALRIAQQPFQVRPAPRPLLTPIVAHPPIFDEFPHVARAFSCLPILK